MENLFSEFKDISASEWKTRLEKDLKGIGFNDLQVTDRNGIVINPFYTIEDTADTTTASFETPDWTIVSEVEAGDARAANQQALENLSGGASGIKFIVNDAVDLNVLLNEIDLNIIQTFFSIHKNPKQFTERLNEYLSSKNLSLNDLDCFIIYDPVAEFASGNLNVDELKSELQNFSAQKTIAINAPVYNNAGANSVYELACTLAQMNEYLNSLETNNTLQQLQQIVINVAVDTLFFEQIAKLRALRCLSALILSEYRIDPAIHLQVITSDIYRSPFDAYSNLLRDTIAGMAGVLGGCDSLIIHSFDKNVRAANDFSNRMSRNQQLIFKEESYLHKVADVANGSYYVNALTKQLSEKAWSEFQGLEQKDGLVECLQEGSIQNEIAQQSNILIADYRSGKRILTGINKYPNPDDKPKATDKEMKNEKILRPINIAAEIL